MVIAAFAAVYVIWGSTYLAIRVAVESLPPFLAGAVRFIIAGATLMLVLKMRGMPAPNGQQWKHAAITGTLLLVGGNGLVMWAEKTVPSALTALLIALTPVWFALLDWARPGGVRPRMKTAAGIVVGFVGVIMLVTSRNAGTQSVADWLGALALIVAGAFWASGSLYSKYNSNTASPWMNSAAQMICGGAGLLVMGVLMGEPFNTRWANVTPRSLVALGYLIVFGSWIGFSAYIYLLKHCSPSTVSTYAYVNPVIAVFLGWLILGETFTAGMLWGAAVVVAGVIIITLPDAVSQPVVRTVRSQVARLLA
ncbi:MAG: EamA family transporter [Verrucomicrobia subdivision 3 bacterium]|nr:EamA family transporter [Limisphaerales bacterium]